MTFFWEQFALEWPNVWGAPQWWPVAGIAFAILCLLAVYSYVSSSASGMVRAICAAFKVLAVTLLVLLLVEPMRSSERAASGDNVLLVMVDASRSMDVAAKAGTESKVDIAKDLLNEQQSWRTRVGQDFDVRDYQFDSNVRLLSNPDQLTATGNRSNVLANLKTIVERHRSKALAGIVLLTDGSTSEAISDSDLADMPPVYPVLLGEEKKLRDVRVSKLIARQTNFESSPVTITANVSANGYSGTPLLVELLDQRGKKLQSRTIPDVQEGDSYSIQFRVKPEKRGTVFYQVRAGAENESKQWEQPDNSKEVTLENNLRQIAINRGQGPYRILYVTGRPNWEFKFLNRALKEDPELKMIGLVRIAKKEPKFTFRSRDGSTNPLFRGFKEEGEEVEQYDEPVIIRLNVEDKKELLNGFPKDEETLFRYSAIVVDDLESAFFNEDQKSLVQKFVSHRGGGFLMLGGQESFADGDYDRTQIGELLPVYLSQVKPLPNTQAFKLSLTKEGLLEPWVRTRGTELEEQSRLRELPGLKTLNRTGMLKPGAALLATATSGDGEQHPFLVTQRFGKGQSAAILAGDLWRWHLKRKETSNDDFGLTWRQTMRWLVSNVPQRTQITITSVNAGNSDAVTIQIEAFDETYSPLDNAKVNVEITGPGNKVVNMLATPTPGATGKYQAVYLPKETGVYAANAVVVAEDGSEVGAVTSGWISEPAADEYQSLMPNTKLMEQIAEQTGGEVIPSSDLDRFARSLPTRKVPVTEKAVHPVWHRWSVFCLIAGCLFMEWGLRRWKGLA